MLTQHINDRVCIVSFARCGQGRDVDYVSAETCQRESPLFSIMAIPPRPLPRKLHLVSEINSLYSQKEILQEEKQIMQKEIETLTHQVTTMKQKIAQYEQKMEIFQTLSHHSKSQADIKEIEYDVEK